MSKQTRLSLLLWLILLDLAAAVATVLPIGTVHNPSLGYASWCSFAPISTGLLVVVAAILWAIRQYVRVRLD